MRSAYPLECASRRSLQAVTAKAFGGWLYLTVIGTIMTFAAYIWLLKRVPPKKVATCAFVAVILGWAVLGEKLSSTVLLGAALVVGSVVGVLLTGERSKGGRTSREARGKRAMEVTR